MPLRKLQEIIIAYAQHLYKEGQFRALDSSVDYPYKGPSFAFRLSGDNLELIDNTQERVALKDGREILAKVDHGYFRKPKRNQVRAAFLKFRYWENKIRKNRENDRAGYSDMLQRELEIIAGKLLPFAVEILKPTAESYSMLNISSERGRDGWIHAPCDLRCRGGTLEPGESVPAELQVKVEEFNDLLRETEKEIGAISADESRMALSRTPNASSMKIRLLQEIIADYAAETALADQREDAEPGTVISERKQRPLGRSMKKAAGNSPGIDSPKKDRTCDSATRRVRKRNAGTMGSSSEHTDANPQPNSRNKRTKQRKSKIRGHPLSAAERRKAVEAYIEEVFDKTGKRITRTDIWKSARYKTRAEFERWQRNDPRATKTANARFTRLLKEKPHLK